MRRLGVALVGLAILVATGCRDGGAEKQLPSGGDDVIAVMSAAFDDGQPIPSSYTCDSDEEESPPLAWSGIPGTAHALALVVDDPDAPGGYVHWVVLDLPADVDGLDAGEDVTDGVQIANSSGTLSYAGPCPPSGIHHYQFTVYALSEPTNLESDADLADAFAAIDEKSIGQGQLVGTYERN
jgi:Raf kinase inhibitor-like YbhB/YbcL family protein